MDKDKLPKIECTTIVTWRNTMTGEVFKDKKEIENDINIDEELNKLIQIKTNQQFEQYSNIYFNKISRNYNFDEF